jgi:hypothetical protein
MGVEVHSAINVIENLVAALAVQQAAWTGGSAIPGLLAIQGPIDAVESLTSNGGRLPAAFFWMMTVHFLLLFVLWIPAAAWQIRTVCTPLPVITF